MAWCEREGMDYIFGLAQNERLKKQTAPKMAQAEKQYLETKAPARVFTEFFYATEKTWSCERRVIAKAEHIAKSANPRFVVNSFFPTAIGAQEVDVKEDFRAWEVSPERNKEQ